MASDASEKAKYYYGDANDWLQANYGKALVAVGILAAAGMFGYFLARRGRGEFEFEGRRFEGDRDIRSGVTYGSNISGERSFDRGYGSI